MDDRDQGQRAPRSRAAHAPARGAGEPAQGREAPERRLPVGRTAASVGIAVAVLLLCAGFVTGLCLFARPTTSETEKRDLEPFPRFTWKDFLSGEYTRDIALWYADTFPGREGFIRAYHGVSSLYGIRGEGFRGGVAEEVPDTMGPSAAEPDEPDQTVGPDEGERIGGFYVSGDTAYELYFFNESRARRYARLVNRAAEKLKGKAVVYDAVIPLSYTFYLSPETQGKLGASDGQRVAAYIRSGLDASVRSVDLYQPLLAHRDEYLFFRTDHHWTATGAYYAYDAFCREAGLTPLPLDGYEKLRFEGFLGTLYLDTRKQALKDRPDVVEAYVPRGTNRMTTHEADGSVTEAYPIVQRATDRYYQAAGSKYNCFLAGDHPLIEIRNPSVPADRRGTSVLLVKESFGNAFAPFLVDQYEYVYVIDYRSFRGDLTDFVVEKGIGDVLFLNNVVAVTASPRLNEMERFVGP